MMKVRIKREALEGYGRLQTVHSHAWVLYPPGEDSTPVAACTDLEEALFMARDLWAWMHRAHIHYSEARH